MIFLLKPTFVDDFPMNFPWKDWTNPFTEDFPSQKRDEPSAPGGLGGVSRLQHLGAPRSGCPGAFFWHFGCGVWGYQWESDTKRPWKLPKRNRVILFGSDERSKTWTVWTGTVTSVSGGIALKLLRGGWTAQQMLENVQAFRARSHFQARTFSSQDRTENDDSKLLWGPKILWFPRSSNLNLCPCTVNPAQIEAGWAIPRSDHWRLTWYPSSDSPWVIHCNIPSYPFGCWLDLGVTPKGDPVVAGEISPVWFLMVH